jgi:tellurite resistance protein TehA-like permease
MRLALEGFPPAAFSIVMATGIVSTAAYLNELAPVAWVLLGINVIAFLLVAASNLARVALAPDRERADFRNHAVAPGFFTAVAGTCVLASQFVVLAAFPRVALTLWSAGALLWVGLVYAFFFTMTTLPEKPPIQEGLNGSWMLIVVGTQSVSLTGTLLAPSLGDVRPVVLGLALVLFLLGATFYLMLFTLTLLRFLFFTIDPATLTPPYWIGMGAVAITTLAGSLLVLQSDSWAFLDAVSPFLRAFTLLFWATATWWIPLLLLLGAWRHLSRRVALRYDLQYWSMVFPLGMYAVATRRLAAALDWPGLISLASAFGYVALAAWLAAFVGLIASTLRYR